MTTPAEIPLPDTIDELVQQVVLIRDKLKAAEDAFKEKTAAARTHKERLEGRLLEKLNELGGEAIKTKAGTVYRTTKKSATIADGEVFRDYVIQNEQFDLADWRANAVAVADYIEQFSAPPPGVNFTTHFTVGVRRS